MFSATQKTTTEAIKGSIVKTTFVELKKTSKCETSKWMFNKRQATNCYL